MRTLLVAGVLASCSASAFAATEVATYRFNNNFDADQSGVAALTATDPLGTSSFTTDTVEGNTHNVWAFNGANLPATDQAGLTATTSGLIAPENYSVDMLFEFNDRNGAYRRILDVQNRQSDAGFYVDPSNNLDIYPTSGSSAAFTNGVYHHIVLTDNGTVVNGYLDGVSQFQVTYSSAAADVMNLDYDTTSNPGALLNVFLDNTVGGGQGEWSSGKIALFRMWDGVLTADEAQTLANNPFAPEPASIGIVSIVTLATLGRRRR